jgi:hypothetical protein
MFKLQTRLAFILEQKQPKQCIWIELAVACMLRLYCFFRLKMIFLVNYIAIDH